MSSQKTSRYESRSYTNYTLKSNKKRNSKTMAEPRKKKNSRKKEKKNYTRKFNSSRPLSWHSNSSRLLSWHSNSNSSSHHHKNNPLVDRNQLKYHLKRPL